VSLRTRLTKAEDGLGDALLWREIQKLATELELDPNELYREARELCDRYRHLAIPCADGRVDFEPVLRAMADGEDMDYDELLHDVKRALRQQRRREARYRK
jgi:hypothetical protein